MAIFGSFFGNPQRNDLTQANQIAQQQIQQASQDAINTRGEFLDRSLSFQQPGLDANQLRAALLGALGPEAQRAAMAQFQQDPGFGAQMQAGIDAIDRSAAARGGFFGGGNQRDLFQFGQQFQRGAFNDRINQLAALSGNAPGTASALTANAGGQIADTQFGTGQLAANQAINFGNALAGTRGTGINNLIGIGRIAAQAFGAA